MPSKTRKQQKAMFAAAEGRGRLGIPVKVAREYVRADKAQPKKRRKVSTILNRRIRGPKR